MQAIFGEKREQHNQLYFADYKNDHGIFHFHSQIELYFVEEGEMEVWVNDRYGVLKKGEMSVALSYDAHAYRTPKASASGVLIIPPYLCEEFVHTFKNKQLASPFIRDTATVDKIRAAALEIRRNPENKLKVKGYIYVILGLLIEHIGLCDTARELDTALSSRLLLYINAHYSEDLSLATLSRALGYSREHISRHFKSCFHIGIGRYITIVRLRHALALMQEGHRALYCALACGFNSTRTFYRAFENEFHCPPGQYPEAIKEKTPTA
jgi:AraC-like DNA-binding protein